MSIRTPRSSAGLGPAVKAAVGVALLATACSFRPAGLGDGDDVTGDGGTPDGTTDDGRRPDARVSTLCPSNPALIECLPFDDDTFINLGVGPQIGTVLNTGFTTGRVGRAVALDANSVLWFDEESQLDLAPAFSIDMFILYKVDPPTIGSSEMQRVGVIDNDRQYGIFLRWHTHGDGRTLVTPYCSAMSTAWGPPASRDEWHHVACVHDGASLTTYVDGIPGVPVAAPPPSTTGGNGTTLGQNCDSNPMAVDTPLVGVIDEVRVWSVALTAAQVRAAAMP
jgi:hypothetical protein